MLAPFDGLNKDDKIQFENRVCSCRFGNLCLVCEFLQRARGFVTRGVHQKQTGQPRKRSAVRNCKMQW